MLCFLVISIIIQPLLGSSINVGSTLFHDRRVKECWNENDIARLRARKLFQQILPLPVTPDKIDNKYIKKVTRYYRSALRIVDEYPDSSHILKQSLADTIGGHLKSNLLPTVRFAYYAGYVPYRQVRELHDLLEYTRTYLNTKGIGWKEPYKTPQWSNLTVIKILIGFGKLFDPCSCLVTKRDANSCIHLPSPKLDDYNEPSAIALPFKIGGLVSLSSPHSENILLKYYTTASRCILQSSPEKCRHSDFVNFNNELWHWMKRDVAPHLMDEKLHVAYGGVLRIAAAVQSYGKGLARRNLFELHSSGASKWHPWKALSQTNLLINTDLTPKLYICLVILAVLAICILQLCYNFLFVKGNGCGCGKKSTKKRKIWEREVAYANVDTTFPAMLPAPRVPGSDRSRVKPAGSKTKSSGGSVKTEKVYDFNENAEKLMEVILSGNEDSDVDSLSVSKHEESEDTDNVINLERSKKPLSPPELLTPIAQLKIKKKPCLEKPSAPMYSTSTASHSDVTFRQGPQMSESAWTGSVSSTSDHSITTESSKTRSRRTRSSRDLAWARRVVSKNSVCSNNRYTTGTEFDLNSFVTPKSHR